MASRFRNYAFLVYEESAPENWLEQIKDKHIPMFVSPLHKDDIDPMGQPKKPHYHIMLMFDGVQTLEQVKELTSGIASNGFIEVVKSVRGYARYLIHLDNPEKAQYNESEVLSFNGADYSSTIGLAVDKYKAIMEMQWYCLENNIVSFSKLCDYALSERYDWYRVLCDSGVFMREYLRSRRDTILSHDPTRKD